MHVLVTADTVGGVWTYTQELVAGLTRRGVQVTLVSFGRIPSPAQTAWLRELSGVDYFPTSFRLEWMPDADRDLSDSMRYLQGLIRQTRPDLLHLSQFCYGALDVDLPRIVVAHSDVFGWNRAVHGAQPAGRWAEWYHGVVSEGLARASLVVAPSRWMFDSLAGCYGAPRRAQVIYNGRTPELFHPRSPRRPFAASAGRLWDEGKQSGLLMELGHPPLSILLAGPTKMEDEAAPQPENGWPTSAPLLGECGEAAALAPESRAEAHDAPFAEEPPPAVRCVGALSEGAMRELLSSASIYVATSKYEPFGLAPLEAAFSGCALVANDIPSLREIWGSAAFYFRRDDAASLGEALAHLSESPELCLTYANFARERASRLYTAARMVDEYLLAYRTLLQQAERAA